MVRPCPSHAEDRTVKKIISAVLFLFILPIGLAADKKDENAKTAQSIDELR